MKESNSANSQSMTGFLAGLASTRGFLLEREIPEQLVLNGELAVGVISTFGADVGVAHVEKAASLGPLSALLNQPPMQKRGERSELLKGLELIEAQLLGWLIVRLGQDRVADVLDEEPEINLFCGRREAWRGWLLEESQQSRNIETSVHIVTMLRKCGVSRKISSPIIRLLLSNYKLDQNTNQASSKDEQAPVLFWAHFLVEIRTKLLNGNTRLVCKWAAKRGGQLNFRRNVIQGLSGLNRAIDNFDHSRGLQLSTYATWWIRQSISRGIMNHASPIRIPVHVREAMNKLGGAFGRNWSPGRPMLCALQLAGEELEFPRDRVAKLAAWGTKSISTGRDTISDLGTIEDLLFDVHALSTRNMMAGGIIETAQSRFHSILRMLRDESRERQRVRLVEILSKRLGVGLPTRLTLEEIGQQYGITRERIRQIESKAIQCFIFFQKKEERAVLAEGNQRESQCEI